jgi:glycosyl transferase, family 25
MTIVYVISLPTSSRREAIGRVLRANHVEFAFEDATDGRQKTAAEIESLCDEDAVKSRYGRSMTPAEIGCALSHQAVWKRIADSANGAVVLEDDALLEPAFFESVLRWEAKAVSKVADIVVLGRCKVGRSSARSIAVREPLKWWASISGLRIGFPFKQWTSGAVGYWISAAAARRLSEGTAGRALPALADDWPFYRDHMQMRVAEARPYVVWEGFETMPSSIESERRLVTVKRGQAQEFLLCPLRVARTATRWLRIAVRVMTGRARCAFTPD